MFCMEIKGWATKVWPGLFFGDVNVTLQSVENGDQPCGEHGSREAVLSGVSRLLRPLCGRPRRAS